MNKFRSILAIFLFVAAFSSARAEVVFSKSKGASPSNAIVITGAANAMEGVASEYKWVRKNRPGWRAVSQSLVSNKGKMYDVLVIRKGTKSETLYFDITSFFGKY